jgi:hypothetical protein
MGRPERPLDPGAGPVQALAGDLRRLRQAAGNPKYLQMQRQTGRSRTALAEAAGGDHLPTWETVAAYVRACGGDLAEWRTRWEQARAALRSVPDDAPGTDAATSGRLPRAFGLQLWLTAACTAALLAVVISNALLGFRNAGNVRAAHSVFVVVQNKVAVGPSDLTEALTPAYLSAKPIPGCADKGCEVPRTQMWSGIGLQAICQIQGARMTNEDRASAGIAHNRGSITSSLWYSCIFPSGARGYLPEIYLAPAYHGGLGLPSC